MTWRCERCETIHETNDPPCGSCGNESLVSASSSAEVEAVSSFVWACEACGREHVKNSPPCSRCGHPMLAKTEPTYDDPDPSAAGYLGVIRPYAPLLLLFALVIGVTASGVVTLDMLPGHGPPSPPDAPGNGTEAAGLDLDAVEVGIHDRLESERAAASTHRRGYDDGLAAFAEYVNRQEVLAAHELDRGERPGLTEFSPACTRQPVLGTPGVVTDELESFADEDELAASLVDGLLSDRDYEPYLMGEADMEGFDVHVADGRVFLAYVSTEC